MTSRRTWCLASACCLLSVAWLFAAPPPREAGAAPEYIVHAVRFASVSYPIASLVKGSDRSGRIDIAFTVWVAQAGGRTVLVDAGFYRDKFIRQWKPVDYVRPSDALVAGLGIKPEDVTDIIVSHSHWDHMDGVDLFPQAKIWIQREEYEYYIGENGAVLHSGGPDADDAVMLFKLNAEGRVTLIDGDAKEILPGMTVYTGGKHTFASQYAGVHTTAGTVVLASDNAYLYENLEKHLPIAQTLDAASNLAAQARMMQIASAPRLVIPGHDPAVFERFPMPGKGVARIQ
jgi:glyoxylase-like metal-dependent hydrolase (beta-lactamase superfamily II)